LIGKFKEMKFSFTDFVWFRNSKRNNINWKWWIWSKE
jgi:hypothetical protein